MTKKEVFALTVAELNLPRFTADWLTAQALPSNAPKGWTELPWKEQEKIRKAFWVRAATSHAQVTVKEVLASLRPYVPAADRTWGEKRPSIHESRFFDKLVKLGLTRFDCFYLPQSTLTLKVMRLVSKEEWLQKPAFILGTISGIAFNYLTRYADERKAADITIGDLINGTYIDSHRRDTGYYGRQLMGGCSKSFEKTRALLRKLGFAYEDGDFMQLGTERRKAEDLAREHNISKRSAVTVVRIARKEGWVRIVD